MRSACVSNMRQIVRAIQTYARDNNGLVPPGYHRASASSAFAAYVNPPAFSPSTPSSLKPFYPELWPGRLRRYLRSSNLLLCPLTTKEMAERGYFYRPSPAVGNSPYTTYGMNWRFSNGGALGGDPKKPNPAYVGLVETLDAPPVPGRTVLLIETQQRLDWSGRPADSPFPAVRQTGGNVTPYGDWNDWFWAIRWFRAPAVPPGHPGGCNMALADGHVVFIEGPKPPYPPRASHIERLGFKWW